MFYTVQWSEIDRLLDLEEEDLRELTASGMSIESAKQQIARENADFRPSFVSFVSRPRNYKG